MKVAAIAALAMSMAGCAGQGAIGTGASAVGTSPTVTGNEKGGKIPYGEKDLPAAMAATRTHCASFGKKAFMTQMVPASEGGLIGFECR